MLLLAGEYDAGLPPGNAAEYAGLFEHATDCVQRVQPDRALRQQGSGYPYTRDQACDGGEGAMPNGTYGRAVPRLALAVAEYRAKFGEWPTHAHGPGVMVIVNEPGPESSSDDLHEYRPAFAGRVRSRLICDGEGAWIEVSGRAGRCAYGEGPAAHSPEFQEAYQWLYGERLEIEGGRPPLGSRNRPVQPGLNRPWCMSSRPTSQWINQPRPDRRGRKESRRRAASRTP